MFTRVYINGHSKQDTWLKVILHLQPVCLEQKTLNSKKKATKAQIFGMIINQVSVVLAKYLTQKSEINGGCNCHTTAQPYQETIKLVRLKNFGFMMKDKPLAKKTYPLTNCTVRPTEDKP